MSEKDEQVVSLMGFHPPNMYFYSHPTQFAGLWLGNALILKGFRDSNVNTGAQDSKGMENHCEHGSLTHAGVFTQFAI